MTGIRAIHALLLLTSALVLAKPEPAGAAEFPITPATTAVGATQNYVAREEDTLLDVARYYDLGYTQLVAANRGIDPWLPGGKRVLLPSSYLLPDAPRHGIVINLGEERLFYYPPDGRSVQTFPIGIAVEGRSTPLGTTRVAAKQKQPTWYPPPSIHAEEPDLPAALPAGPNNPLGAFALYLGWPGYLIHGTNKPDSVGRMASHGCIHLYPEDIERLFNEIPVGTPVTVIDEAVKVQWVGDALFVEVHPSAAQALALESGEKPDGDEPKDLTQRVHSAIGGDNAEIDWRALEDAGRARTGVPQQVAIRHESVHALVEGRSTAR